MGITLSPQVISNFASWVAPLSVGGAAAPANAAEAQTVFQIRLLPAPGTLEYTVEIDGQPLRYRNAQSQWANLVWPNPQGTPGARISAITFDGRAIEVVNHPGRFGLERMINAATRKRKESGVFELTWVNGNVAISLDLKIISSPQVTGAATTSTTPQGTSFRGIKLPANIVGGLALPPIASQATGAAR